MRLLDRSQPVIILYSIVIAIVSIYAIIQLVVTIIKGDSTRRRRRNDGSIEREVVGDLLD